MSTAPTAPPTLTRSADPPKLRVAITGSTGFVGSLLVPALRAGGHEVVPIVRRRAHAGEIMWDPANGFLEPWTLGGVDAVVHLAGENIAARWSAARKQGILESRRMGTTLLAKAIAAARPGPRVLLSASAIGYYGDRGDEELTEESAGGAGFLPEVCRVWEESAKPAAAAGRRVVQVRIGLPQSSAGGMLAKMLLPFRLGLGGRLGAGKQWMSWIAGEDLVRVFLHALLDERVSGPVNAVAPNPVRNGEFTEVLGRVLRRPTPFPIPAPLLRLALGDLADEALLASARVVPAVLQEAKFEFLHPHLEPALRHLLEGKR